MFEVGVLQMTFTGGFYRFTTVKYAMAGGDDLYVLQAIVCAVMVVI